MIDSNNYDIDKYLTNIADTQDIILMKEAVQSTKSGLYRSAYILIWLCCAESLKHKFQIVSRHGDKNAEKTYQKITQKEAQHCAVDSYILERAKAYGFINELEFDKLNIIYNMRCVYAHPYKEAPTIENILSAFCDVYKIVLSKSALFTESYIDDLLTKLNNDKNFLNDFEETVREEAKNQISKINPDKLVYFFEKYVDAVEKFCFDINLKIFTRRAKWFIDEILLALRYEKYTHDEWHNLVFRYPKFFSLLISVNSDFFLNIGERAQDYSINKILDFAQQHPSWLGILVPFIETPDVLRENYSKILNFIENLSLHALKSSGLSFIFWFRPLLRELEAYDFNIKNAAVSVLEENESFINTLQNEQQFALGEALHIAALHNAWEAESYVKHIASQPDNYPTNFLKGFCRAFLCKNTERNYMYCRETTLDVINLLLNNLNNGAEIVLFVNSLINEFINYEKEARETDFKEINETYHFDRYSWFSLL